MIILTRASRRLKSGLVTFNTLLVGGDQNALDLYLDIKGRKKGLGNKFIGYIDTNGINGQALGEHLPKLGRIDELPLLSASMKWKRSS